MRNLLCLVLLLVANPALADEFTESIKAFDRCYVGQLDLFRELCEPADQVAIAIVNGCPDEMGDFISAATRTMGPEKARELGGQLSQKRQEQAIAALMRQRLVHPCSK